MSLIIIIIIILILIPLDFIDTFNIGSELNNFPDYSEIVAPYSL